MNKIYRLLFGATVAACVSLPSLAADSKELSSCEAFLQKNLTTAWRIQGEGYQIILDGNKAHPNQWDALAKTNGTIKVALDGLGAKYNGAKNAATGDAAKLAVCKDYSTTQVGTLWSQASTNKSDAARLKQDLDSAPKAASSSDTAAAQKQAADAAAAAAQKQAAAAAAQKQAADAAAQKQAADAAAAQKQAAAAAAQKQAADAAAQKQAADAAAQKQAADAAAQKQAAAASIINVSRAVYGANCSTNTNVSAHIAQACNGRTACTYPINHAIIGDTAPNCAKTYSVTYQCAGQNRTVAAPAEASGKQVQLPCGSPITIVQALYGANCRLNTDVTAHIASACNGRTSCAYPVNHTVIGDTAPGCAKTYTVDYQCGARNLSAAAPAEASGRQVQLACQ